MKMLIISTIVILFGNTSWAAAGEYSESPASRTDWFQKAGYGIFVHYLDGVQNDADHIQSLDKHTSWDECVREFDTERFAEGVAETGAGYVIFSVTQATRFMAAPNATYDRITGYAPGEACATRDLIEDLYQSLHRRGVPLMLYWSGDGPRLDAKAAAAYGCGGQVSMEFVRKWADTFREYGERYGDKIAGVWCDACYASLGYDEARLRILADGLRAGYPGRIIAMNPGVQPRVSAYTPLEDYTCGEQNQFVDVPSGRFLNGEQWHILSFLSKIWWGEPGVGYGKAQLAEYVSSVNQHGGVVSFDMLLFRDGGLDRSQIEALKAVRRWIREGRVREPIPPGNKAWRKQSRLLSLDGLRPLEPNGGVAQPWLGVDGKQDTIAQPTGEWAWIYEVDLVDTVQVKRVRVTFGICHPTHFEISVSTDGVTWRTIAERMDHDGKPFEAVVGPVSARYARVRAIKPDGPDQAGVQMSIAELEVYD